MPRCAGHAHAIGALLRAGLIAIVLMALGAPTHGAEPATPPRPLAPADGWITLFDGTSLDAFRRHKWKIADGAVHSPGRGRLSDLSTDDWFNDFELEWEWRISAGGDSGVVFHEDARRWGATGPGTLAPEYQMIDDGAHPIARNPRRRTGGGDGLLAPRRDAAKPVGEWNASRLISHGTIVEHWLNGEQVLAYDRASADFKAAMEAPEFQAVLKKWPAARLRRFATGRIGPITFLDEKGVTALRAIRIRRLTPAGQPTTVPDPLTIPREGDASNLHPGLSLALYQTDRLAKPDEWPIDGQTPNQGRRVDGCALSRSDLDGIDGTFFAHLVGEISLAEYGFYRFAGEGLGSKAYVWIDGAMVYRPEWSSSLGVFIKRGRHAIEVAVAGAVSDADGVVAANPPPLFSLHLLANDNDRIPIDAANTVTVVPPVYVTSPGAKRVGLREIIAGVDGPGDGRPLAGVHPGWDLIAIRPPAYRPQVTGMDFLSDGRLALTTWKKQRGEGRKRVENCELHLISNVDGPGFTSRVIAKLDDAMGVKVVDGDIYVVEKTQLLRFRDTTGDGSFATRDVIAKGWPSSGNFHEFSFGLEYHQERFWVALSVGLHSGGPTLDPQPVPGRGSLIAIDPRTGTWETVACGLRTPDGMTIGPGGDLFICDGQGGWLPSSKLLHVKRGRFYGAFLNPPGPFEDATKITPPVVWFPHGEAGRSPGQMLLLPEGFPFAGQMVVTDVAYGGLRRVFLEQVKGEYQGCVLRFSQGLECGSHRLALRDGALYVGGIGNGQEANWGWKGTRFGLEKLKPNGKSVFEMHSVSARRNGLLVRFTEPAHAAEMAETARYQVRQWWYKPTPAYGGPKMDDEELTIERVVASSDGKSVFLVIPGMKEGRVVHLRLMDLHSAAGRFPWATEAWYTLNAKPDEDGP